MPRAKEPSWPVQKLIYELLVRHGNQPVVIERSLDILISQRELDEDTPGLKWIQRTIQRLQELDLDVLAELPPSVWKLRTDYEAIRGKLKAMTDKTNGTDAEAEMKVKQIVAKVQELESGRRTQGDNRQAYGTILARKLDDHWTDLAKLAEELMLGLNFPSRHVVKMEPSRFGGKTSASWFYDPSGVSFSAQMNPLWQYLQVHLDCRYSNPKFSKALSSIQVALARLLQDDRDGDVIENLREARNLTQSLGNKLWLVVQRCTFDDGVCDICENWFGNGSD